MLKMITRDRGEQFWISRTVVVTSPPGISMSSSTTSGCSAAASSTVFALSPAWPTTRMSSCVSRIPRTPSRTSAWSSTIKTVVGSA
jgi:hypothetical protein